MKKIALLALPMLLLAACSPKAPELKENQAKTQQGIVEGTIEDGIRIFKGVPFAAPPVGENRWREPQPVQPWEGVRMATEFGDDPMQLSLFGDMNMKGPKFSEDCLYLNIWAPLQCENAPVLIYFNGGGLMCGSGSEPRYAGDSLAHHGIVSITASYREGYFGFLAHPELTAESPNHTTGNYGILDQVAAIQWVKDNIAAFGGDPNHITIVGESAGSFSVSILMGSPLSRNNICGAIASSGAEFAPSGTQPIAEAEAKGKAIVEATGKSIAELRALPAEELQALLPIPGMPSLAVDGYLLDKSLDEIYAANEQAQVPLMGGWNSMEAHPMQHIGAQAPTLKNFTKVLESRFGKRTKEVLNAFGVKKDADVLGWPGIELSGALFTAFPTWKWFDYQVKSGNPAYRYFFTRPRPAMTQKYDGKEAGLAGGVKDKDDKSAAAAPKSNNMIMGAVHSADIEYAMGNLHTNDVYAWEEADYQTEQNFMSIYINFIKTGNPNGEGVIDWPAMTTTEAPVLQLDSECTIKSDANLEAAYKLLDEVFNGK